MFNSKRQKRQKQIRKLSQNKWKVLPEFLITNEHFEEFEPDIGESIQLKGAKLTSKIHDPSFRNDACFIWLDFAEEDTDFAKKLDRFLGLRTDREDKEYHEHWATKRNKVYVWIAILAIVISLVSLTVSIFTLQKSS